MQTRSEENSISHSTITLWNRLPNHIEEIISLPLFRKIITQTPSKTTNILHNRDKKLSTYHTRIYSHFFLRCRKFAKTRKPMLNVLHQNNFPSEINLITLYKSKLSTFDTIQKFIKETRWFDQWFDNKHLSAVETCIRREIRSTSIDANTDSHWYVITLYLFTLETVQSYCLLEYFPQIGSHLHEVLLQIYMYGVPQKQWENIAVISIILNIKSWFLLYHIVKSGSISPSIWLNQIGLSELIFHVRYCSLAIIVSLA